MELQKGASDGPGRDRDSDMPSGSWEFGSREGDEENAHVAIRRNSWRRCA